MFKSLSKIEVLISGENREPYYMAELIKVPLGLWSRQGGDQGTMYELGVWDPPQQGTLVGKYPSM